jgi:hypothetical protein
MVWAVGNAAQNTALHELVESQASDRVVGIVGGAILEESLKEAMIMRLRSPAGHSKDVNEKLFKVGGPLGNFQPKIDLGYQLYMFDKPTRTAMYGVAEIRNLFAHQLDMTFKSEDKKMVDASKKLILHQGRTYYPHPLSGKDSPYQIERSATTRDKFFVNLKLCLLWLAGDYARHQPWCNTPIK